MDKVHVEGRVLVILKSTGDRFCDPIVPIAKGTTACDTLAC